MVIGRRELSRRDHADLAVQSTMIEPVDVLESLVFDVIETAPGSPVNQFCLVQTVSRSAAGSQIASRSRQEPRSTVGIFSHSEACARPRCRCGGGRCSVPQPAGHNAHCGNSRTASEAMICGHSPAELMASDTPVAASMTRIAE
jgi:hypothetical protein